MRADANAVAIAARDFGHGSSFPLEPRRRPRLSYTSFDRIKLQFNGDQGVHVAVRTARHNAPITGDRDLRDGWLMRTPIAHRGLHAARDGRPENSLAAFAHACALGF